MAYTKAEDFNEENNKNFINYLNKKFEIGISISDQKEWVFFLEAITTPTFAKIYNESKVAKKNNIIIKDYQVNEFKGDAILGYIVVTNILQKDIVCKMHSNKQKLISNESLSKMFDELGLENYLYTQSNMVTELKVKADVVEALIFAIHEKSKQIINSFLNKYLKKIDIEENLIIDKNIK